MKIPQALDNKTSSPVQRQTVAMLPRTVLLVIVAASQMVPLGFCCTTDWRGSCDAAGWNVRVESCPCDNTSCTTVYCDSLAGAIGYVQEHYQRASVTIDLCSSCSFELEANSTIDNSNVERLYLSGNGSVVDCTRNVSVTFSGKMNVTIESITFKNCSTKGTLRFVNVFGYQDITLAHFEGSGLSFLNVSGTVSISNTTISGLHVHKSLDHISALYVNSKLSYGDAGLVFSLTNCSIVDNINVNETTAMEEMTRGTGMFLYLKRARNSNHFFINNCTFANNVAYLGGSISVLTSSASDTKVDIRDSVFRGNKAAIGSATDFYCAQTPVNKQINETCLRVVIRDSHFARNEPFTHIMQMVSSTVCVKYTELELNGKIVFYKNNGSAIASEESDIFVNRDSNITFTGNVAQRGAGLNLFGSFVHIYRNTEIKFLYNRAIIAGGAIYSNQNLDLYVQNIRECFVQYNDDDCVPENSCNPDNWNTSLIFKGNKAMDGGAIFTVSVIPCLWHNPNTTDEDDRKNIFCKWKSWHIEPNCTRRDIATSPWKFRQLNYELKSIVSGAPVPYKSLNLSVHDELDNDVTDRTIFTMVPAENNSLLIVAPNYHKHVVAFGKGPRTENWYIKTVGERTVTAAMAIHMIACPPGFRYDAQVTDCECSNALHAIVHCFPNKTASIQVAYCVSYLDDKNKTIVYGRCIFTAGNVLHSSIFIHLPNNDDIEKFCRLINRKSLLCGDCISNHSVDVFSDSYNCKRCSGSILDWSIYVMVESIPVFVLFAAVVALHLSLTSGPVNGYIFCCQVVTVTIEVIFTKTSLEKTGVGHAYAMTNFLLIPSNIWSLDFFRIYKLFANDRPTCLGSNLKVMHLLALRYLSAFYPLLFLIVSCILIELHARNCRCLVRLWNPVGFIVSRFRRTWDIRTSLVDAFAAFILLSYVKIIRVSLLLSTHNTVHDMNGKVLRSVLHYDPIIIYASPVHMPFLILGILLLLTFGLFFPLLLLFYQFRLFQKCLHMLKLNRNGLRIFMDAFQGCYKDGKDNGPDRRFFAGLYFIFRLLVFGTFNIFWNNKELYITLQSLMILFALVTAVLRPYKKDLYNFMDTFFFCALGIAFGLHVYVFDTVETDFHVSNSAVYAAYVLELIPFVYVMCYMGVWVGKRIVNHKRCRYGALYAPIDNSISWRFNDTEEFTSLVPDAQTHNTSPTETTLSLTSTLQSRSGRQRRSTVSTSLVDTSSYGSIED